MTSTTEARSKPWIDVPDEGLIDALLEREGVRLPDGLPEAFVARGERVVAPPADVLLRRDLWDAEDAEPGLWAPVGAIGSPGAALAILELIRRGVGEDFLHEVGPCALGRTGCEALDLIE